MRKISLVAALGVVAGLIGACDEKTCDDTLTCNGASDADGSTPPTCKGAPKDDPSCVSDAAGVFVSAAGDDAAAGTKSAPVKTLSAALGKRGAKKSVFVCEGIYAETLTLGASENGLGVYGGFGCADWAYTGVKPVIGASSGLKVDGITSGATFSDVQFVAADAVEDGASSIAATVSNSSGIVFERVSFKAGAGKTGTAGIAGATAASDKALAGDSAIGPTPAPSRVCKCIASGVTVGTSTGGGGGIPNGGGAGGEPLITPPTPSGATGAPGGGAVTKCSPSGFGADGSDAPAGIDASKSDLIGTLEAYAWMPRRGADAEIGKTAQGGGGGSGISGGGAGGAGGCGGCPGLAGTGGAGGGSSLALVTAGSTLSFRDSEFAPSNAGDGGNGGAGGMGAIGGIGGSGASGGCGAGNGGKGGDGGAGAGGAGGLSVGVLYTGSAPTLTNTTVALGKPGLGGKGGKPGVNDGLNGVAQDVFEAK